MPLFSARKEPLYDLANPTVAPIRFSAQLHKPMSTLSALSQAQKRSHLGASIATPLHMGIIRPRPPVSPFYDPRRKRRYASMFGAQEGVILGAKGQSAPASVMGSVESSVMERAERMRASTWASK